LGFYKKRVHPLLVNVLNEKTGYTSQYSSWLIGIKLTINSQHSAWQFIDMAHFICYYLFFFTGQLKYAGIIIRSSSVWVLSYQVYFMGTSTINTFESFTDVIWNDEVSLTAIASLLFNSNPATVDFPSMTKTNTPLPVILIL